MISRAEYDNRNEERLREANETIRWEAFYPDAVDLVEACLKNDGDLVDLLNTLDLMFDEYDSLTNEEVNKIVIEAAGRTK